MKVPFVDLRAQHDELRNEITSAIQTIIDQSAFIGGQYVEEFEAHFAEFCGAAHAVACASGTDALKLALMACGVRRGEEIITTPHTFFATAEAITMVGAYPVFVDIDGPTYNLSPERLADFLEKQCRPGLNGRVINRSTGRPVVGIIPVHLYGLPADIGPMLQLAAEYQLVVIEDACQAHGATYVLHGEERRSGSMGHAAAFSFYPSKNLGAMGEGGIVTTNSETMAQAMRILRDHGQIQKYRHISADGWNGRLDALQCAILDIKLKRLEEWNERRRQAAEWYRERLAELNWLVLPIEPPGRRHVYHLFVIRMRERELALQTLAAHGIGVATHYPFPLHLQKAYQHLGYWPGAFPEAERAAAHVLSLPMFPHITEAHVDYVCSVLKGSFTRDVATQAVGT